MLVDVSVYLPEEEDQPRAVLPLREETFCLLPWDLGAADAATGFLENDNIHAGLEVHTHL